MASSPDSISMALFCDFENVALGVRDAKYDKFDIKRVLERLLLKGSIVVKKAYCDWDRYKSFKAAMHEANFELIEIPHVRQSGKNSADIRLVVDALDLCYTKSHVDTFVIISGDSDFSPLVSKLRENAKQVIGVGVKQSTSDLLIANCDEFIFYDDLVRDSQRAAAKREARDNPPATRRSTEEDKARREELESRRSKAIDIAVETFEALLAERGESGKIWSSMLKEAIKRRKPDFNESYFGFRAFGNLLEEAQARGLLELGRDEKSGIYVNRPGPGAGLGRDEPGAGEAVAVALAQVPARAVLDDAPPTLEHAAVAGANNEPVVAAEPRRGRTRGRGRGGRTAVEPEGAELDSGLAGADIDWAAPATVAAAAAAAEHHELAPAPQHEAMHPGASSAAPELGDETRFETPRSEAAVADTGRGRRGGRRGGQRGRAADEVVAPAPAVESPAAGMAVSAAPPAEPIPAASAGEGAAHGDGGEAAAPAGVDATRRAAAKPAAAKSKAKAPKANAPKRRAASGKSKAGSEAQATPAAEREPEAAALVETGAAPSAAPEVAAGKPAARARRPRKPKTDAGE
ncbi:NYN domain-containing protein [Thauera sp.]|jgi:uncharacterized protein (TIGR00288 family)|uniref:NYN domain-containing protein n=1 Tax=Thauera sp. TaxID=1905334 RepID=UPI002604ACC3|nr:NYN domain-containing protein [Thauera sp.]